MNFFFGAVASMSFFISTSLILRLSRVRSTWGGGLLMSALLPTWSCVVDVCGKLDVVWVHSILYLRPDVVVEALDETRNDPHSRQRGPAHFVLLEEVPEGIATHI